MSKGGNSPAGQEDFSVRLYKSVSKNLDNIKKLMDGPEDLIAREFILGSTNHPCAIVFIDGLVDKDIISDKILKNMQLGISASSKSVPRSAGEILQQLEREILSIGEIRKVDTLDQVMYGILSGDTVVFVDGAGDALLVGSQGWASRGVDEPMTETVVRGPRDGFTENIRTNTSLVRRRVRDPNLRFISYKVGRRSKRELIVAYVDGIAHPKLVQEVRRRIATIDIDDVPESGYVEQWIEDSFLSPFPQIQNTERPDKLANALLQGQVAILLDGTPFALFAPITFGQLMQSPEDYSERWLAGSLLRLLRFTAAFIAIFLPSLYIALVSFHPGMIPSKLAFSIAATREGVPFPAVIEALLMEATMELLREAGIRLPKPIGQTIGIVGGLVIGEAAVAAGIVSPIMVIVVAVTAIASFAIPAYNVAISLRMLRFSLMFVASVLGFYGVILVYIMLNIHIVNLKSFGIPYSTPFAPFFARDWKDLFVRAPITMNPRRPQFMQAVDEKRVKKEGEA